MVWRSSGIAGLATVMLFAAGEIATHAQKNAESTARKASASKENNAVDKNATSGKSNGRGNEKPVADQHRDASRRDMGEVTPEREAAALKFVELHHKQLLRILQSLQSVDEDQYERAIEEIFRASERLARMKSRSAERYEYELELWKIKSRRNLLIASLPMVADYEQAMRNIQKTISRELEIQNQLLQYEAQVTRKRLNRIEESLKRQQDNFETNVDRQLQRIRKAYPPSDTEGKPTLERRNKK
ncbi:hypothetical protein [Rubinisphaera sp. JC750]|uniref:hypothetical protein n=1 Tax=Rubinisphaera sp. JC750 TaxID=2898658 RepID=UPI001F19EA4E|nr:hypothetical protein [Rubinisphaera sp. JC750]